MSTRSGLTDDGGEREARLLSGCSLESDTLLLVLDEVGGDGRVVGDLLNDEEGLASVVEVGPVAVEHPEKYRDENASETNHSLVSKSFVLTLREQG